MTEKNKINIGKAIKQARIDKGLTMQELADILGYKNRAYVSQVESGGFSDADTPKRFFKALGLKFYDTYAWRVEDPNK